MLKNLNSYSLALGILIVLLQLLYPPFLKGSYSYIFFIMGAFIINGGYKFVTIFWKRQENYILKIFNKPDLAFLVFMTNTIALSSFFYYFYLHNVVFADSLAYPSGIHFEEYIYQEKSFFITAEAFEAMEFWEFSIIILLPLALIVSIINGFTGKKNSNIL